VNDVTHFQNLVHEGQVSVAEVDGGTGSGCEVVGRSDGRSNQKVIEDFAVDFSNDFVSHEVEQSVFGVHVVDGFHVLSCFKGP